jgi:cytochrome c553
MNNNAYLLTLALVALMFGAPAWSATEQVDELVRTTLELEPKAQRGGKLYEQHCQSCHEVGAVGSASKLIPSLAGQRRSYLIKQLADFAEAERTATKMHAVVARKEAREPQEWADLTAYLNNLPVNAKNETGHGEHLSLGEASYEQWCVSCHSEDGRGDDDGFVPSLRNQHYSYLLQQMRDLASGHRFNVESELTMFLNSLDQEEMIGLADYSSRMRGPIEDRAKLRDDGSVGD